MNKRSFTLIEITIALVVLAIGLMGVLVLFPVGFDALRRTSDVAEVSFLAQEKMEELKRDGFSSLPGSDTGTFSGTTYGWTVTTTDVISDELKQVDLVVTWVRKGISFSETFITYVANLE